MDTPRLILRLWKEEDLAPFAQMNACAKVCEFLSTRLTREESDALAHKIITHFEKHGFGLYAVEEKASGQLIGFTGLSIPSFEAPFMPAIEIGWRLDSRYWGKGYATEAAQVVLDYAFYQLALPEIISFTTPTNYRSRRVMEKIGMTHNINDDFDHPVLPENHPLRRHVLYRKRNPSI
jgi:RimJ/RimL family protein N-acetyltransferase